MLEVISKGKVAQHFKKGTVAGCLSHVFNVSCPDTFLTGGNSSAGRDLRTGKIRFQRGHACVDQQQAFIILWNQRKAFHHQMPFAFKKVQIHFS